MCCLGKNPYGSTDERLVDESYQNRDRDYTAPKLQGYQPIASTPATAVHIGRFSNVCSFLGNSYKDKKT